MSTSSNAPFPAGAERRAAGRPAPDATVEEIDLDEVDIRLADGTRLTDDVAAEIVAEVQAATGQVGRPSLTGAGRHSPHVSFRVAQDVRTRADDVAAAEGVTVSQLARRALEEYLAKH